jgi:hypothetical protein
MDRPSINFMKGQEFFSLRPIYKKGVHHKGKLESPYPQKGAPESWTSWSNPVKIKY